MSRISGWSSRVRPPPYSTFWTCMTRSTTCCRWMCSYSTIIVYDLKCGCRTTTADKIAFNSNSSIYAYLRAGQSGSEDLEGECDPLPTTNTQCHHSALETVSGHGMKQT